MIYLSKVGLCRFGPYLDPPLVLFLYIILAYNVGFLGTPSSNLFTCTCVK